MGKMAQVRCRRCARVPAAWRKCVAALRYRGLRTPGHGTLRPAVAGHTRAQSAAAPAEDNEAVAEATPESMGCTVRLVNGGAAAIPHVDAHGDAVDVVVSDIEM